MYVRRTFERHGSGLFWVVCAVLGLLIACAFGPKRQARSSGEPVLPGGHSGAVVSGRDSGLQMGNRRPDSGFAAGWDAGEYGQGRGDGTGQTSAAQGEVAFYLAGQIQPAIVRYFMEWLATAQHPVVIIDSPGGYMTASLDIASAIKARGDVTCHVRRQAGSGAFGIFQACAKRTMSEDAQLMTHRPSFMVDGMMDELAVRRLLAAMMEATATWDELCRSRLKLTHEQYVAKVAGHNWVMSRKEAIEVGAADGV